MPTTKPPREIAIVGFSPKSMGLWKELPKTVEIWTANAAYQHGITRIDRFFDVHDPVRLNRSVSLGDKDDTEYFEWLYSTHDFPIYTIHPYRLSTRIPYPIEEVCVHVFGDLPVYLTSSASYMLALAIHEKVNVIHVLGIDAKPGTEYAYQKAGIEFLIGVAANRGIKIVLPPPETTNLLNQGLYGMGAMSIGIGTIEHAIKEYEKRIQPMQDEINAVKGAIHALRQLTKVIKGE